jgi:succinoglycan biosynthesis transport protein ExoP
MQPQQLQDAVPEATEPRSVDLRDYGRALRRHWVTLVVCAVLGVGGAAAYAKTSHSGYVSTAEVVLPQGGQLTAGTPTPSALSAEVATEQLVAVSTPVAELAAPTILHQPAHMSAAQHRQYEAHLAKFLSTFADHLSVTTPTGSSALQISWKSGSPAGARLGANAFASAYLQFKTNELNTEHNSIQYRLNGSGNTESVFAQIVRLEQTLRSTTTPATEQPQLSTELALLKVEEAQLQAKLSTLPTSIGNVLPASAPRRSGLSKVALAALGLLVGLLLGVAVAILRDLRNHTVRNPEQLASELAAPVLAIIPVAPRRRRARSDSPAELDAAPLVILSQPDSAAAQSMRALRSMLVAVGVGTSHKVLLVACADPVVTSSRFAAELGTAIAESGRSVLLVGTDLRQSTLAQIFEVSDRIGVSDVLAGTGTLENGVQRVHSCGGSILPPFIAKLLRVLPSGPPIVRPLSLLDSDAMVALLAKARAAYDYVLLDCPGGELLDSLAPLARVVDGVVVVAGRERTETEVLRGIRQRVSQVGSTLLGAVLQVSDRSASSRAGRRHDVPAPPVATGPSQGPTEQAPATGAPDEDDTGRDAVVVTKDRSLRSRI